MIDITITMTVAAIDPNAPSVLTIESDPLRAYLASDKDRVDVLGLMTDPELDYVARRLWDEMKDASQDMAGEDAAMRQAARLETIC